MRLNTLKVQICTIFTTTSLHRIGLETSLGVLLCNLATPNYKLDLFDPSYRQPQVKRVVSEQLQCLVEKEKLYWEQGVLPAFDGQTPFPTPDFGDSEDKLSDSWTSFEDPQALPQCRQDVFESTTGGVPTENFHKIALDQRCEFASASGDHVGEP